jgi:hypothetical protein
VRDPQLLFSSEFAFIYLSLSEAATCVYEKMCYCGEVNVIVFSTPRVYNLIIAQEALTCITFVLSWLLVSFFSFRLEGCTMRCSCLLRECATQINNEIRNNAAYFARFTEQRMTLCNAWNLMNERHNLHKQKCLIYELEHNFSSGENNAGLGSNFCNCTGQN